MANSQNQTEISAKIRGTVSDPPDFNEGGAQHRKSVLASAALVLVLLLSSSLKPALFGVAVPVGVLWMGLTVAHIYFFVMWRLTAPIENDKDKKFWNISGLLRQAFLRGTGKFPGKTKAQILFLRALPIWAFLVGLIGIAVGFSRAWASAA